MKATITIDFEVDGKRPPTETLERAFLSRFTVGYIGSELIDGTNKWGIAIERTEVSVDTNKEVSGAWPALPYEFIN